VAKPFTDNLLIVDLSNSETGQDHKYYKADGYGDFIAEVGCKIVKKRKSN
jgi:hypothetical protein